ncbi:hypothetical protein [Streptomyces yunnanensis]|uniref:Uncharacterized protein n=1 Tax=Streptomyces yunnanensis TaxID=156453 RepID=A0A9X8N614_9ACTN|nr:hypothetical protein [Streptomyces yunnanensis]SHN12486.1 hypothetical protein SAMN05216268_12083 [Streptomyces yunnanensis]
MLLLLGGELLRQRGQVRRSVVLNQAQSPPDLLRQLGAGLIRGLLLDGNALLSGLGTGGGEVGFEAGNACRGLPARRHGRVGRREWRGTGRGLLGRRRGRIALRRGGGGRRGLADGALLVRSDLLLAGLGIRKGARS